MRKKMKNMDEMLRGIAQSGNAGVPVLQRMVRKTVVSLSAQEFIDAVNGLSEKLINHGLQGKCVGILGTNTVDWMIAYCAVTRIGSTAALMNAEISPKELHRAVEQTNVVALLVESALVEIAEEYCEREDYLTLKLDERYTATMDFSNWQPECAEPEDIMCIIYTSGTTGNQKAVMLSNRAVMAGIDHYLSTVLEDTKVHLSVMPLHHAGALFTNLAVMARCGSTVIITDGPMRMKRCMEAVHPNTTFVVPSLLRVLERELLKKAEGEAVLGGRMKNVICGGAQLPTDVIPAFQKKGIHIMNIYGATESTVGVVIQDVTAGHSDSIGVPYNAELMIRDGELMIRGDTIMSGYYGDPEETAKTLLDGWYLTGDIATMDEDGRYYLIGRKKNLIILSNGENISPEELEKQLILSPDVCEVIVTERNDSLCAVIHPEYPEGAGDAEKEQVRERVRLFVDSFNGTVPTYKEIRILDIREEALPKNASGKIYRR